jgi:hypothetical protein
MNRPLIALNDAEVAYAPGFCEDSFRHVVSAVFTGSFEPEYFTTPAMRKYVGSANAASGLEFNKSVASRFREAGWNVWTEIEMSQLHCPKDQAAGDIDVVAERDGAVFLCECKDLLRPHDYRSGRTARTIQRQAWLRIVEAPSQGRVG